MEALLGVVDGQEGRGPAWDTAGRPPIRHGQHRLPGGPERLTRIVPMPDISRDEVRHLADLARIELDDAELDHLAPQLSVILDSIASISEVAADDIPPTSHPLPVTNVFRPDVVRPSLTAAQALSGAPQVEEQRFAVPRILGDEQ